MATSRAMQLEAEIFPYPVDDRPSVYDPTPYLNGPRHDYLRASVPNVDPRILSRAVDRAMKRSDPMLRHCNPPLLALQEAAPNIYAPHIDKTKASEVFGRRVLPKLRRDLDSKDHDDVMRGIMAISDIVHDPEKVCEAVRVGLAAKLIDLMQDEDPRVRERSCAVAETLAGYSVGRDAVLAEPYTVPVLKMLTFDPVTAVRFRAALTLRILARFRLGPYDLDEADLAPFLVHLLLWEVVHEIIAVHLAALQLLLELDSTKEICIYQGAFNPLHAFMHMHLMPQVAAGAMECMSRLASCTLGKLVGDQLGIVSSLQIRLMLCAPDPDLCRSAAMLVMNLTHTTHERADGAPPGGGEAPRQPRRAAVLAAGAHQHGGEHAVPRVPAGDRGRPGGAGSGRRRHGRRAPAPALRGALEALSHCAPQAARQQPEEEEEEEAHTLRVARCSGMTAEVFALQLLPNRFDNCIKIQTQTKNLFVKFVCIFVHVSFI